MSLKYEFLTEEPRFSSISSIIIKR
jgi:hypothetical protein